MKVGRNDPCPCGSGRKFKKCHLATSEYELPSLVRRQRHERKLLQQGKRALQIVQGREMQREHQQGLGRPIISAVVGDTRFVAVHDKMFYGKWKTFSDFLGDYLKLTIGSDWGNAELKKPFNERHPILKWYDHICTLQRKHVGEPGEVYSAPMTGAVSAYYRLSYNLYLIAHNNRDVQSRLLRRLKDPANFQGAYFETQVAAWLIRSGFELEFEDETDTSTTHCEFTATFKATGRKFSVEAKSRNPAPGSEGPRRINVARQLGLALRKNAAHERLVFLDLNRPINTQEAAYRTLDRAERALDRLHGLLVNGAPAPAAYVCLTNISDQYFPDGAQLGEAIAFYGFKIDDYMGVEFPTIRHALRAREKHVEMFRLMESMQKHRHIPSTFDGELPSVAFSKGEPQNFILGETYLVDGPDGKEVAAEVSSAVLLEESRELALAFFDRKGDRSWIARKPLSDAEFQDYQRFPDTAFGIHQRAGGRSDTPLELFDFLHETYRKTSKEKLLDFMKDAPDIEQLRALSQAELSEAYCERLVYSVLARRDEDERKKNAAETAPPG